MKAETADYPQNLKINVASINLAQALYQAQCEAFGPASGEFKTLPQSHRRGYVEAAESLLRLLAPAALSAEYQKKLPRLIAELARQTFHVVPK